MNLTDKVVVIAGGGSGLGLAVAQMCLRQKAKVAILDLKTHKSLSQVLFIPVDIQHNNEVKEALQEVFEKLGAIHINVNCAGIAYATKLLSKKGLHPLENFEKVISINLIGTFNVMSKCVAIMAQNEGLEKGVIINTSSAAATEGQIGQVAYAASKGGINSMTLPAARELATLGIRVNSIAPGLFNTPLLGGLSEEVTASLEKQVPFPARLGEPREFAHLVKSIIENKMINGAILRLDGALRMNGK